MSAMGMATYSSVAIWGYPPAFSPSVKNAHSSSISMAPSKTLEGQNRRWVLLKSSSYRSKRATPSPQHHRHHHHHHHHGKNFGARCSSGSAPELKIMIAGAPASGKGTQCELIVEKFGLTHISAGDLLRAEVSAGTEAGMIAKEYMNAGKLVPSEVVVKIVKNRLAKPDASKGWLLDGYPRSLEQAEALEAVGIRPQLFILLDVPDDILVERVVGRRSDPVTGRIYHLTFQPPENEEIASRLVQRSDDTEEKVKPRVDTHNANVGSVIGVYKDVIMSVNGNRPKLEVFGEIENFLSTLQMEGSPAL